MCGLIMCMCGLIMCMCGLLMCMCGLLMCMCGLLMCTCCTDCIDVFPLDAGLLASSQYPEGPATGHLGTGFFFVSLCLKVNAGMVPKIPSCYYMLLMWPSGSKLDDVI
jgi:hypothetical protein